MNNNEYRISEYCGEFDIEIRAYKIKGMLWWKKKIYFWVSTNQWGGAVQTFPIIDPFCESFKTLKEAQKKVKEWQKGVLHHECK